MNNVSIEISQHSMSHLFFVCSSTGAATRNSTTFPLDSDLLSEGDSPTNDQGESGQSLDFDRRLPFSCRSLDDNNASSSDPLDMIDQELMSHPKFKQTILQRYLNDTYNHAGFRVDTVTANDERKVSDSLCSRDYEEMSTPSSSPRVNGAHQTVFDGMEPFFICLFILTAGLGLRGNGTSILVPLSFNIGIY